MLEETNSPADRRRLQTRREILDAAWDLCRAEGLQALSLRDLAARVGMRAPSLYSYFASKDAIYDAMFADGQRQLLDHLAPFDTPTGGRAELRAGVGAFFEFCTADPVRYQLLFQRTLPGFVPSPESYALAEQFLALTARALATAGVTAPAALDLWTALVTGLVTQQVANDPGGDRWTHVLDEAVEMFCDHTGIPTTPRPRPRRQR